MRWPVKRINRAFPHGRRLPACTKLGGRVGYHCDGFLSNPPGIEVFQERPDIVDIPWIIGIPANPPDLTRMHAWDHLLDLADPLGYQVRRAEDQRWVGIEQFNHSADIVVLLW